jgi:TolB-like protein/class 3 adenylate cyclase/Tfp pilus assembly protein PilF
MATARIERRLAAILAADVVGYSRLMERDEAGTFARLKTLRHELVEPVLARHGGRFVDLKGDGAIVEFHSVVAAVEAAIEIQRAMLGQDPELPEAERIRYRIGINLGEVIVDGDTIYGDGVNVAARIEALCEPGGIWLSRGVYNQVKGKLELALVPSGLHQVKNISEAVETFRVALDGVAPSRVVHRSVTARALTRRWLLAAVAVLLALVSLGGAWQFWPDDPLAKAKPSVAVLPFGNLGGDEATGRLADGITEDIITDLARFRDLDVIARNSTQVYKGKPVDVRQVGKDLNVRYVLEGSIQRQSDRVRITGQLIDAESGAHVWSERWDRSVQDVFAVQSELAEAVAGELGGYTGTIVTADREVAKRKQPQDLTTYDLYLLGVEAKNRETKEGVEEAIRLLKQSLDIDPKFARAWTGLAWSYSVLAGFLDDPREVGKAQADAARRAVELDPADAEAHAALAYVHGTAGDLPRVEAELDKALSLNPNSADILTFYAGWASSFGKAEEGMTAAERAMRLNPNMPAWALNSFRYAYFMVGRYEDALRMQDRRPRESYQRYDYVFRAASLAALGRVDEARAAVAETLKQFPNITVEGFAGAPEWSEAERRRLTETMRKAGFPICADKVDLKNMPGIRRLSECTST